MGSNIFGIMSLGKTGLLNQQLGIEVTGQNIANVQTKGYTKQEVVFEANNPRAFAGGQIGTGVKINGIQRSFDKFLFNQTVSENSSLGNLDLRKNSFDAIEAMFNNNFGNGVNSSLSEFFNSFQDLANNPNGLAERAHVVARAGALAQEFNRVGQDLFQERLNLDQTIEVEIEEINALINEIAELNSSIHTSEANPNFQANDLRDRRDKLTNDLAKKIDIQIAGEVNGQISLTLSNGMPLVLGLSKFQLNVSKNGQNDNLNDIILNEAAKTNITSTISDGKLKGLIDMRDKEVKGALDKLDRLAAALTQEVNRVHSRGIALDGTPGISFFNNLSPTVVANSSNTGSAAVAATNVSPTTNSVDKYEIEFTESNSFTLNNLTTGLTSGTFTFSAGNSFNLLGGLSVKITGTPATGDRFEISVSENASNLMKVSDTITANSQKIAAGKTFNGDGENARLISDLQASLTFDGESLKSGSGAFTFDDFYNSIVSTIGVNANTSRIALDQQESFHVQLFNRRESRSGVSIDEEMINLIKFQQAFSASARVISTVEEMIEVINDRI